MALECLLTRPRRESDGEIPENEFFEIISRINFEPVVFFEVRQQHGE